jgi:hypothetical protein
MSGERLPVWEDPGTVGAIESGRALDDIAVLNCRDCGQIGYYNQGSSFWCRHCEKNWYVAVEEETYDLDFVPHGWIVIDVNLTLADVLEMECEDY